MSAGPLTDYRVVEIRVVGPREGLTRMWAIHTGRYHKEIGQFTSRREALGELARLVNERHAGECPNRPEWAAPVPAISPEGFCFHCSKVAGTWIKCSAAGVSGAD